MDRWLVIWDEKLKVKTKGFELGSGAWGCYEDLPNASNAAIYRRHYIGGPNARYEWKLVETQGKSAEQADVGAPT